MKKSSVVVFLVSIVVYLAGCASVPDGSGDPDSSGDGSGWSTEEIAAMSVEERLAAMTLRQKIGQRFIVYVPRGFGTAYSSSEYDPTAEYLSLVKTGAPAGMIVYPWNFADRPELSRLSEKLQLLTRYNPLGGEFLITADQEGGRVAAYRFREMARFPAAADIARQADSIDSKTTTEIMPQTLQYIGSVAYVIGVDLQSVGINMNFAPVLDLSEPSQRTIIGDRSFGVDPERVSAFGISYLKGLSGTNVIPTVKHFPGHGVTDVDSHGRLPIVDMTIDELWDRDLVPFRAAVSADVPAIMTAHILFPMIDPDYPVTISEVFLVDVLRRRMGYEGVVVSDGLSMGALADNYEIDVVLERALRFDVDLILIHDRYEFLEIIALVERLISEDRVTVSDIERGALRVLQLKERYGLLE